MILGDELVNSETRPDLETVESRGRENEERERDKVGKLDELAQVRNCTN